MKLRWTIVGLILLTLLGLVAVVSLTLQSNLGPLFHEQEQNFAQITLSQVQRLIDERYNLLANTAASLAHSDSSYASLQADSTPVSTGDFNPARFRELEVSLMALVDLDGNLVHAYAYDLTQSQEIPLPEEILPRLQPGDALLRLPEDRETIRGLLRTQSGPLLLASAPVLRSDGSGPALGTLLVGRFLDAEELQRISKLARLPLSLVDYNQALTSPGFADSASALSAASPSLLLPMSETEMSAFQLLSDLYEQPAYILRVTLSRTVARNSQLVLNFLLITLAASVFLFGVITILSVDRLVLAPLHHLGRQVAQIGRRGDLSERVSITGRDELGRLGADINQMLADLQQSQRSRQESEERFGRLVESMDDMVFTLDERITQINLYGDKARKLGLPEAIPLPGSLDAADITPQTADDYGIALNITAETLRNHIEALRLALAGQHLAYEWSASVGGEELNFQSVLSPVTDDAGRMAGVVGVTRDISGLKSLENTLRQRVRDLNALNDVMRAFLSQLDAHNIFHESCRLLVEHFDVDAAWLGILREDDLILRPAASEGLDASKLPPLITQGKTAQIQHPAMLALLEKEPLVLGKSTRRGEKIWATLAPAERNFDWLLALPVTVGESRMALTIFSRQQSAFLPSAIQLFEAFANLMAIALNNADLFNQVRADQARLQSLSQRLVEIQEEERREIALELHDEVGQLLTGLKIKLDAAGSIPPNNLPAHLEGARQLAEDLIKKVRSLSLDLRPSMLDDLGLLPAFLWHFDRYTSLTGIQVHFVQNGIDRQRFPPNLETTAYRIVQEGLTNIARHARVNEATVRVLYQDQVLTIQIEDRGAGFNADETLEKGQSRGLLGMRERVAFVGGSFTIDSVPGWGTLLVVELPVPQQESEGVTDDQDPVGG